MFVHRTTATSDSGMAAVSLGFAHLASSLLCSRNRRYTAKAQAATVSRLVDWQHISLTLSLLAARMMHADDEPPRQMLGQSPHYQHQQHHHQPSYRAPPQQQSDPSLAANIPAASSQYPYAVSPTQPELLPTVFRPSVPAAFPSPTSFQPDRQRQAAPVANAVPSSVSATAPATGYKPPPLHQPADSFLPVSSAHLPVSVTLAVAFLVLFLFLVSASSSPLLWSLSAGLLGTFLLSSLGLGEAAAVVFLVTMTCYSVLLLFFHSLPASSSSSSVFAVTFLSLVYSALAAFVTFFTLSSPVIAASLSRSLTTLLLTVLYAVLPLLTSALAVLMILPHVGLNDAAFYYLIIYAAVLKLIIAPETAIGTTAAPPAASSPPAPSFTPPPHLAYFHCYLLVLTPCMFHSFVHSAAPLTYSFVADFLILLTLPFLLLAFLSYFTPYSSSPFAGSLYDSQQNKEAMESAVAFVASFVLVGCLEYRVVILSFSSLLYYHASSPFFSILILTLFLYSSLIALILLLTGLPSATSGAAVPSALPSLPSSIIPSQKVLAFHISVLVASISLALTLGLLFLIPLLPVVSYAFSSFFFTRSLLSYAAFLCSVLFALVYFSYQHFLFLSVTVADGMPLSSFSFCLIALTLLALMLPAVPLVPLPSLLAMYSHSTSFLLLLYVSGLSMVEYILYSSNSAHPSPIYPSSFVVLTSALAVPILRHLLSSGRFNRFTYSLLLSLLIGKLSMLMLDTFTDYLHGLLLALALTSPYTMYTQRMHWLLAVGHSALIVISLLLAKNTVLAHLLKLVGVSSATESTFVAAFLIVSLLSLLPLSAPYSAIRRLHFLLLVLAIVFAVIQPRFPTFLFSGESDVFDVRHDVDRTYSDWLLMAVVGLLVAGIGGGVTGVGQLLLLVAGALCMCAYVAMYLPVSFALYLFFGVIFVSAALITAVVSSSASSVFISSTSSTRPASSPQPASTVSYPLLLILIALYCTAYPLTFLATAALFVLDLYSVEEIEQSRIVLFTTYAGLSLLLSLVVTYHRLTSPPVVAQAVLFHHRPAPLSSFASAAHLDLHSPLVTVSNVLLLLSYLSAIVLLVHYLHESELAIVWLSPLLLFVQYEASDVGDSDSNKVHTHPYSHYFPMFAVTAALLASSALAGIAYPLLAPLHALTPDPNFQWSLMWAIVHLLLLLACLPLLWSSLSSLASSAFRRHTSVTHFLLLMSAVLCIVGVVVGQMLSVRLLAVISLLAAGWTNFHSELKGTRWY